MATVDEEGGGGGGAAAATVAPAAAVAPSSNLQILEPQVQQPPQDEQGDQQEEQETGNADKSDDAIEEAAAGSFDCNICLELAQDPVVTLCGHLFCWPCLYKWMQLRPVHKECPVCKASIQDERVIPLYGRGIVESAAATTTTGAAEQRSSSSSEAGAGGGGDMNPVHELEIPSRPPGQRSDNSSSLAWHARRFYDPYGIGFIAGAAGPTASARFGNITFSAGFGLFPSLFRLQFHHGFPDSGASALLPYGTFPAASSHQHHLRPLSPLRPDQQETLLSRLLLFVGGVMILCFLYF